MRNSIVFFLLCVMFSEGSRFRKNIKDKDNSIIDIFDLTRPTTSHDLTDFYGAIEKRWKICVNCGIPALGTAMHLEHASTEGSMKPAVIPTEYLLTRLAIIDVSYLAKLDPSLSLTLDVALQWAPLKQDPKEPTLILFKFGWQPSNNVKSQCVCKVPGISYELAEYIASNLSHVVGVATDAPTLESEQTREFTVRTVSNLLGKNGIYIIENVNVRKRLPAENSCMTIAMPVKLLEASYVPTRLTAFCPSHKTDRLVTIALKKYPLNTQLQKSRIYDVSLTEILH